MKWFYNAFEKQFIKHLHRKNGTKLNKDNMIFSFHDLDGNSYYSFPKDLSIPIIRLGKLQEFYTWLSAGITGQELSKLIDAADKALTNGLTENKGIAKIGFILSELKDRKNMVIHPELYYNIIAAQLIRDDEKVNEWNNDIHMQKVEAFKKMDAHTDVFFLATQELIMELGLSTITKQELQKSFRDYTARAIALMRIVQE